MEIDHIEAEVQSRVRSILERTCHSVADKISNGITVTEEDWEEYPNLKIGDSVTASEYFMNALDINYVINTDGSYKAVKVFVSFPNVWVNTDTMAVEGYWFGDHASVSFSDKMGIDDWFEELYYKTIPTLIHRRVENRRVEK